MRIKTKVEICFLRCLQQLWFLHLHQYLLEINIRGMREELIWGLVVAETTISYSVWWPIRWEACWGWGQGELEKITSSISNSPCEAQTLGISVDFYKSLLNTEKASWGIYFHSINIFDCTFHWSIFLNLLPWKKSNI